MKNKSQNKVQKYGIFYMSNGRWTSTPYAGKTFTATSMKRSPLREDLAWLQNYHLKSKMLILPV